MVKSNLSFFLYIIVIILSLLYLFFAYIGFSENYNIELILGIAILLVALAGLVEG